MKRRILLPLVCLAGLVAPARALEPVPDRLVVLTFDDSAKSHFTVARPLLRGPNFMRPQAGNPRAKPHKEQRPGEKLRSVPVTALEFSEEDGALLLGASTAHDLAAVHGLLLLLGGLGILEAE